MKTSKTKIDIVIVICDFNIFHVSIKGGTWK